MNTIKTHCHICSAELLIPAHEVVLTLHVRYPERDYFRFVCPACGVHVVRTATEDVIACLIPAQVVVERIVTPDEVDDPRRFSGNLTADDLLDFVAELEMVEELGLEVWG